MLDVLGIDRPPPRAEPTLDPTSRRVFDALRTSPATADELVGATRLTAAELALTLTHLELAGLIAEGEGLYRAVMPAG